MKKYIVLGTAAALALAMTSCDDFLNDNRYPLSETVANAEFWNSETNCQGQVNSMYNNYAGYGNASSTNGTFYYSTLSDDQGSAIGGTFRNWTYTAVPASSSSWNSPYENIRRCNLLISGVEGNTMEPETQAHYIAVGKLNRAYQYYQLVRAYGDVVLVKTPLDVNSDVLYEARTNRNAVMDFVLEDLNYATSGVITTSGKTVFSTDMANAMKIEICLFEAAYAKYNQNDTERANKFYNEVLNACKALMGGKYKLCDDYQSLYNSANTAMANGMPGLDSNSEIIFFKPYIQNVFMHSLCDYSGSSTPIAGMTRDAFENYLFLDGKPMSQQADKADVGTVYSWKIFDDKGEVVKDEDGEDVVLSNYSIKDILALRDKRLAATIDTTVYYSGQSYARANTMNMTSSTGYGVSKFDNLKMSYGDVTTANKNYTAAPLFWYARVLMAYAEAKAELNQLSNDDLNISLNLIFKRAGLPEQTVEGLSAINDDANNMNVSSLIWEIRRCRRCEFMFDDDIRYWDLARWNQLELLDSTKHPKILQGANVSEYENVAQISVVDGYIDSSKDMKRVWDPKYKFYPIPSEQIKLNEKLGQNDGWK